MDSSSRFRIVFMHFSKLSNYDQKRYFLTHWRDLIESIDEWMNEWMEEEKSSNKILWIVDIIKFSLSRFLLKQICWDLQKSEIRTNSPLFPPSIYLQWQGCGCSCCCFALVKICKSFSNIVRDLLWHQENNNEGIFFEN